MPKAQAVAAVLAVLPPGAVQGRKDLVVVKDDKLPYGASYQSGGDNAPHFGTNRAGRNGGAYTPVGLALAVDARRRRRAGGERWHASPGQRASGSASISAKCASSRASSSSPSRPATRPATPAARARTAVAAVAGAPARVTHVRVGVDDRGARAHGRRH